MEPLQKKQIIEIEQIQRSFTYQISEICKLNYWERLEKLKLKSLQRRREITILKHIWKIKNEVNPNSINLNFKHHNRTNSIKLVLPPLTKIVGNAQTKLEESFAIKGAKLWNALPSQLT